MDTHRWGWVVRVTWTLKKSPWIVKISQAKIHISVQNTDSLDTCCFMSYKRSFFHAALWRHLCVFVSPVFITCENITRSHKKINMWTMWLHTKCRPWFSQQRWRRCSAWRPFEVSSFDKSPPVFSEVLVDYMLLCCWPELMMLSFQTLWWMFSNSPANWRCSCVLECVWLMVCVRLQGLDEERVM